jgi:hypothetical protein
MTDDEELARILAEHKTTACPSCGHEIGFGDIAWNNGDTESGTPYSYVDIQCAVCQGPIAQIHSWWPEITDNDDLLRALGEGEWRLR